LIFKQTLGNIENYCTGTVSSTKVATGKNKNYNEENWLQV